MKYLNIFVINTLVISLLVTPANGQCIAEAGDNAALCTFYGLDTFYLGGSPTAHGGTPPYTYNWSCQYFDGYNHWTAVDFLDNPALPNPSILNSVDGAVTFHLNVQDSNGAICSDSVLVQFSSFGVLLNVKHEHILQGDSVQLYTSVYGGIPPISYIWSPPNGLTDPADVHTWAKPNSTTTYHLLVTDSAGCQLYDNFYVFVIPTATEETENEKHSLTIVPNPLVDISYVKGLPLDLIEYEMKIFDLSGRMKKHLHEISDNLRLTRSEFEPGLYFFKLLHKDKVLSSGKFIAQ